jgi:hypothetical protein
VEAAGDSVEGRRVSGYAIPAASLQPCRSHTAYDRRRVRRGVERLLPPASKSSSGRIPPRPLQSGPHPEAPSSTRGTAIGGGAEGKKRGKRGKGKRGDRTCHRRGSAALVAHVGREAAMGESRLLALLAGRRATLDSTGFRGSALGKFRALFTRAETVRGIRPQFPGSDSKPNQMVETGPEFQVG